MFSKDRKICDKESVAQKRMVEYGGLFDELHIVVLTKKNVEYRTLNVENVWIYPTNSLGIFFSLFNAHRIGKRIIENLKFEIRN